MNLFGKRSQLLQFKVHRTQLSQSPRLTLHLVIEGELLSRVNTAHGKQSNSWEPLIDVVNEHVKYLQVGITLQTQRTGGDEKQLSRKKSSNFLDYKLHSPPTLKPPYCQV